METSVNRELKKIKMISKQKYIFSVTRKCQENGFNLCLFLVHPLYWQKNKDNVKCQQDLV